MRRLAVAVVIAFGALTVAPQPADAGWFPGKRIISAFKHRRAHKHHRILRRPEPRHAAPVQNGGCPGGSCPS